MLKKAPIKIFKLNSLLLTLPWLFIEEISKIVSWCMEAMKMLFTKMTMTNFKTKQNDKDSV